MKKMFKKWIMAIKKMPIALLGCLFLIVACVISLSVIAANPSMAIPASPLTASFSGEYKIDGNKLYMDSETEFYTVKVTTKKLEFTSFSQGGIDEELLTGVIFKRQ